MTWVFWLSVALIAYAYAGYPLWLWLRRARATRPVRAMPCTPSVSVLLAVHNEQENLPRKLENLAALDYPADRLEIVVVSDGSTDGTNEFLASRAGGRCRAVFADRQGKAAALNRAVEAAQGEVLVFMDARQRIEPDALRHLMANFADSEVGAASGELMIGDGSADNGVGIYWTFEKVIRLWEAETGSTVGATGAIYAVRRELVVPLPPGTILDDVLIPMNVARRGYRVVFEPRARAWDPLETDSRQEFRRKVRTLTGNYQLLQLAPWLLTSANPLRFEFISHKLARLLVPFALGGALLSSLLLDGVLYRTAAVAQLGFYGLSLFAAARSKLGVVGRIANVPWTFVVLNTAAVVALYHFLLGKKEVWVR